MFEKELHNAPAETSQQGDLFHNYELRDWDYGPRNYKILLIAIIFNLSALFIVAQTDLLTQRGCETPWVGSVCQVLDMAYVSTVIYGTTTEYADEEYQPTDIDDSEVVFVDVSGAEPQFVYPYDYFCLANPVQCAEQQAAAQQTDTASYTTTPTPYPTPYPTTSGGDMMAKAPVLPKQNPNSVTGDTPDSPFSIGNDSTTNKKGRNKKGGDDEQNTAQNDGNSNTGADPKPLTSEQVESVVINKQPLTDFADGVAIKWATKQVDLAQKVNVVLNGVITEEGKLDRNKSKFDTNKQQGDPQMIDVAKSAFEALGDSGYLFYLKAAGLDKFTATLSQNDETISITISSPQKSEERAKSVSSQIAFAIMLGKVKVKNPSDERTLLDAAKAGSDGKNFVLSFTLPKPVAQEMINRKLQEAQARKAQQQQPNSGASRTPEGHLAQ